MARFSSLEAYLVADNLHTLVDTRERRKFRRRDDNLAVNRELALASEHVEFLNLDVRQCLRDGGTNVEAGGVLLRPELLRHGPERVEGDDLSIFTATEPAGLRRKNERWLLCQSYTRYSVASDPRSNTHMRVREVGTPVGLQLTHCNAESTVDRVAATVGTDRVPLQEILPDTGREDWPAFTAGR